MDFFNSLFGRSNNIEANEAHQKAVIENLLRRNRTYQKCMQDIRLSASAGNFETNCFTRDPEVIDLLKNQGYQVNYDSYSEYDHNYGFPESITCEGIKVSWEK